MIITDLENGKYKLLRKFNWNHKEDILEEIIIEVENKQVFMPKRSKDSEFRSVEKYSKDKVQIQEGNNISTHIWSISNLL